MSKYIQNRKDKIEKLSQQLTSVNERIHSYISFLNDLKNKHHFFVIDVFKLNNIKEETTIFATTFHISFF